MKFHGKEMPTIHPEGCKAMTWEDAERMEKRNADHGWSIDFTTAIRMLADHMDAYTASLTEKDAEKVECAIAKYEMIEWRLADANFHGFCKLLHENKYAEAFKYIDDEYIKGVA